MQNPQKKLPAEVYIAEGKELVYKGKFSQAIDSFKKAIKVQPHHINAMNDLGLAYLRNNQFDLAIQTFKKTLELNHQFANVYKNLGNAYRFKGNYSQAMSNYMHALQINPNLSQVYDQLGLLYIAKDNDLNMAIKSFQKALELDNMNINALNNITKTYLMKGDKQNAIIYNQKALKVCENSHIALELKTQLEQQ